MAPRADGQPPVVNVGPIILEISNDDEKVAVGQGSKARGFLNCKVTGGAQRLICNKIAINNSKTNSLSEFNPGRTDPARVRGRG